MKSTDIIDFFTHTFYYERHFKRIIQHHFPMLQEFLSIKIVYKNGSQLVVKKKENNYENWEPSINKLYAQKIVELNDFCIYVCINNYEKYCSVLNNNAYSEPGNKNEFSILKSFIEKVCEIYSLQLKKDIENNVMTITPTIDVEVLLIDLLNQFVNEHNLISLNLLTALSALPYEGQACCGKVVFTENAENRVVEFAKPILISTENIRAIRKYLQISQSDVYVEVQKNRIVGLTSSVKKYFHIEFLGHMRWQILYNNDFVMQYKDGRYYIVNPSVNQNKHFLENINNFCKDNQELKSTICSIIKKASKQSHGTMIVFTSDIGKETDNFSKNERGIPIAPISLKQSTNELILGISGIDGALMCDLSGICYMIGAILDGESTIPCNTARGSRYNSALTYISSRCNKQNIRILIAIFSEDGSIDIIYNEGNKIVK